MTAPQRVSISNGIWLCQTHAALIDRDVVRFPVELLHRWKKAHEAYVEANIGARPVHLAVATLGGRPITDEAARIALERLEDWEYRLFAQLVRDEVASSRFLALDVRFGVSVSTGRTLAPRDLYAAKDAALGDADALVNGLKTLIEIALPEALKFATGGDAVQLAYVATRLGDVYRAAMEWALLWLRTRCSWTETTELLRQLPRLMDNLPGELAAVSEAIEAEVDRIQDARRAGITPAPRRITLKFTLPQEVSDAVGSELRRLGALRPDFAT